MTAPLPSADPQHFDSCADAFHQLLELGPDIVADRLRAGWLPGGQAALDVGCGAGRHTGLLAEQYEDVRGIDLSAEMLRHARPHPRVRYEQGDLFDAAGRYDLVFSVTTLHHVDERRALEHLWSLVAPGGTLAIVDCVRVLPHFLWNKLTLRAGSYLDYVRERRKGDPHAAERLRLKRGRQWLDHMASDRYPTPDEWRSMSAAVLHDPAVELHAGFIWIRSSRPR